MNRTVPFGSWPSPLSTTVAAQGGVRFAGLALSRDRDGGVLAWWSALEDGANAVRVARPGARGMRIEAVRSARSRVNEYGGGAFWVHGEVLFWVDDLDQRIRMLDLGIRAAGDLSVDVTGAGVALTPETPAPRSDRYAAGVVAPDGTWMVVEREQHTDARGVALPEAVNDLAWVSTEQPGEVHALRAGADFVVGPTLSGDGTLLAWLQWNHPDMPWDAAELWAGALDGGSPGPPSLTSARRIAGGHTAGEPVSACLPQWDPSGHLWWCDDREDRWTLRRAAAPGLPGAGAGDGAQAFYDGGGEVGVPRWVSGGSRYGFADTQGARYVVLAESVDGLDRVVVVPDPGVSTGGALTGVQPGWTPDPAVSTGGALTGVQPGWTPDPAVSTGDGLAGVQPGWIDKLVVDGPVVAAVAGAPAAPTAIVSAVLDDGGSATRVERFGFTPWPLPVESISTPEPITFPTGQGDRVGGANDRGKPVAHGLFYPPALAGVKGPAGALPPLVVRIHGGPTAAARAELTSSVQFWTTRGFAVVEVNYRGSTGYGRAYRNELLGGWGAVEVADCIAAAEFLATSGRVDPGRCVIRGGSAGGFTALEAITAQTTPSGFRFAAATTLYGVTDLLTLAADTHKFESKYLDGLVGQLPEAEAAYRERSPLRHPERITSPVLILQGLEDPVVPPSQAEVLVAALKRAGVDHEYRTYPGEGHGFRNVATLVDVLGAELDFYRRVLGIRAE